MTTEKINLIGIPIAKINGCKLPTVKEVLLLFFYHHKVLYLKVNESAKKTANIVQDCWKNLQILTSGLKLDTQLTTRILRLKATLDPQLTMKKNATVI